MSRMNRGQWLARQSRPTTTPRHTRRLHCESLEDRRMLAVLSVNSDLDNTTPDPVLTLREATLLVNSGGNPMAALGRGLTTGELGRINNTQPFGTNDTIRFAAPLSGGTIQLGGTELEITQSLTIDASILAENVTIDAQQNSRVLFFSAVTGDLTLNGLNIQNGMTTGSAGDGGGIRFDSDGTLSLTGSTVSGNTTTGLASDGGGIFTLDGAVTLTDSTVSGNTAYDDGGGIYTGSGAVTLTGSTVSGNTTTGLGADGGGIFTFDGAVTLTGSTVSGNTTTGSAADGGGIFTFDGAVTLTGSTVSGNSSGDRGGGIHIDLSGDVTLTDSTISDNTSVGAGGGIRADTGITTITSSTVSGNTAGGSGGGLRNGSGSLTIIGSTFTGNSADTNGGGITSSADGATISGSLIAGNTAGGTGNEIRQSSGSMNLDAYNLIGRASETTADALDGVTAGTTDILATSDGLNVPLASILGPLQNNGGPTFTHALVAGSPAINAGDPAFDDTLTPTDQRGAPRVSFGRIDIGAFEFRNTTIPPTGLVVGTNDDVFDGLYTPGNLSLREAVILANADEGSNTITFASVLGGQTIALDGTQLEITETVTIDSSSLTNNVTIDAQLLSRVFYFSATTGDLSLVGLDIANGFSDSSDSQGGAIRFDADGTLSLTKSLVSGSSATGLGADGGGIYTLNGAVMLDTTMITGNHADDGGGGIFAVYGNVTLMNSTVSANEGTGDFSDGGGIFASTGNVSLTDSTVSGNSTSGGNSDGGGIYTGSGDVTLTNSTVSGNTAGQGGGGIYTNSGTVTITHSTISGNSASTNGGGILVDDSNVNPTVTLENAIVAGNTAGAGPDLFLDPDSTLNIDYSLIGDATDSGIDGAIGTGNILNENPMLGTLQNNGGPTETISLLPGSPAINAGDPAFTGSPNFDQRGDGFPRVLFDRIDIGAYEFDDEAIPAGGLVVDTTDDVFNGDYSIGDLSLREAVELANANAGAQTITFDVLSGSTILLEGTQLEILDDLTVTGPGSGDLAIDAQGNSRVLRIASGTVNISGLTIGGGSAGKGGGIRNEQGTTTTLTDLLITNNTSTNTDSIGRDAGGGIWNKGELTITRSEITNNTMTGVGGGAGIWNGNALSILESTISGNSSVDDGGGIYSYQYPGLASLTITDSTISGNSADSDAGGIWAGYTDLTILGSTISGNSSYGHGGGILAFASDDMSIEHSTIQGNAGDIGGGISIRGGMINIRHTLVTGNTADTGGEIYKSSNYGTVNLNGYNLLGDSSKSDAQAFSGVAPSGSDITATSDGNTPTALSSILDTTLADNGGLTPTHGLVAGSPAINAGDSAFVVPPEFDQRGSGFPRVVFGRIDIGAYEFDDATIPGGGLVVDTTDDVFNGDYSMGDLSLREAVELANANAGAQTITFAAGLSGQTIALNGTELEITETVTIDASSLTDNVTIDAQQLSRILRFSATTGDLSLVGLNMELGLSLTRGGGIRFDSSGTLSLTSGEISGSSATDSFEGRGGGIYADSGNVTLTRSFVSGNTAGYRGGGVYTNSGNVTLDSSTVSENSTTGFDDGGGIYSTFGKVTMTNSTISANSARRGGGIFNLQGAVTVKGSTISGNSASNGEGGGIYAYQGTLTVTESTISGNSASREGGGIYKNYGIATIIRSTITGNSAGADGGGIFVDDTNNVPTITLENSIVAGNTAVGAGPDLLLDPDSTINLSFNLIGDNTDTLLAEAQTPDMNGNLIGSANGMGIIDPLLVALADNGGPTLTHALLPGSPAIDMGDLNAMAGVGDVPLYDQRGAGFNRVVNGRIDIGAFEVQEVLIDSADFDEDGDVDGRDFLLWQRGVGTTSATKLDGDANNDMEVDGDDLTIWQVQFGQPAPVDALSAVDSASTHQAVEQPLNASLVDAAMALEWMDGSTEIEDSFLLAEEELEMPWEPQLSDHSIKWSTSTTNSTSAADSSAASDEAATTEDSWVTHELLESVFG